MRRLKQFFHKLSIRKKMLTILCLVGMLPVLVLGISLGINSYRTVLKYREKDMTNTLQQACGIVDYQMYACQQMMNYFVYNRMSSIFWSAIRQRRHSVMNCIRKYQILSVR